MIYEINMDTYRHSAVDPKPVATVTVTVPLCTVSELNRHEHWRHRQKRAKAQHDAVNWAVVTEFAGVFGTSNPSTRKRQLPLHVHLTRLAPRKLDTDNLAGALKHVRDAVAHFLGVDDGDETKVSWSVGQEKAKTQAVRIEFYRRQP